MFIDAAAPFQATVHFEDENRNVLRSAHSGLLVGHGALVTWFAAMTAEGARTGLCAVLTVALPLESPRELHPSRFRPSTN